MSRLWVGSWMVAGHQKDQAMIRSFEFLVPPPTFQRGERTGNGIDNWSHIHEESSIKFPTVGASESSRPVNLSTLGGWHTPPPRGQKLLCSGPSQTSPSVSRHLAVHLYPLSYPLAKNVFPGVLWAALSSKLIEPKEGGLWNLQSIASWSEAQVITWAFWLASEVCVSVRWG